MESRTLAEAFAQFTTCDVADALVKLGVPNGGVLPSLTLWSPEQQAGTAKVVGSAYTVQYSIIGEQAAAYPPPPPPPPPPQGHFVDDAPIGSVILISAPQGAVRACWGGLTTRRAQALGVVGTVVDGCIRDLDELRELSFPVFARGVSPSPPHGAYCVSATEQPISIIQGSSTLIVNPGDVLVGDLNGVVSVPKALIKETLKLVEQMVEGENASTLAVMQGASMTEAVKLRK